MDVRENPPRRNRGSALILTTVMIIMIVALIGLLLSAPEAQLRQVSSGYAKERSIETADAGVREAIDWIYAYKPNLNSWCSASVTSYVYVTTNRAQASGNFPNIAISMGTTQVAPATLVPDPTTVVAPGPFLIVNLTSGLFPHGLPDVPSVGSNTNSFPNFVAANFKSFGDSNSSENQYAFAVYAVGNGYYRILVQGNSTAGVAGGNFSASSKTVSTYIEAYVRNPVPVNYNPGAVTFTTNGYPINNITTGNTTGWTNPDIATYPDVGANPTTPLVYNSMTGGGSDKVSNTAPGFITGIDQYTVGGLPAASTAGVDIQGGLNYDNTNNGGLGTAYGSPPTSNGTANIYNTVNTLVSDIVALPAGTPGVTKATYAGSAYSITTNTPQIYYLKIPDNAVVNSDIFDLSGSSTFQGALILDVGSNVTFNFAAGSVATMRFNGNPNQELGAFIIHLNGPIKIPSTGWYLGDDRGNNTTKLAWNSFDYDTAISNIKVPLKIASYRIYQ